MLVLTELECFFVLSHVQCIVVKLTGFASGLAVFRAALRDREFFGTEDDQFRPSQSLLPFSDEGSKVIRFRSLQISKDRILMAMREVEHASLAPWTFYCI